MNITQPGRVPVEADVGRLSPRQRQTLQSMLKLRDESPTAAGLVSANWWRYLILLGYFALLGTGVGVGVYFGQSYLIPVGCGFGGMLFGVFVRDFGMVAATSHTWPVTREVIDWQKVQQLLDEDDREQREPPAAEATEYDEQSL